jgi:hypothetical protein
MSANIDSIIESVEALYNNLRTPLAGEDKEQGRELFRVVLRALDAAAPWPTEDAALLDRVRDDVRKALALFSQGLREMTDTTLEQILNYLKTSRPD